MHTISAAEAKRRFMELDRRIPHIHGVGKQFQSFVVRDDHRKLRAFSIVENTADFDTYYDGVHEIHHIKATGYGNMLPAAAIDAAIKDIDGRIS
jgi:hypothetical protein